MSSQFKFTINSEFLIDEVKKRPCLYDGKGAHGNQELKNTAWGEIGALLFKDKWPELTMADKDTLVRDMQVKWKSIRDNYTRQLRVQTQLRAGLISKPIRRYVYMDRLSFLKPYVSTKREPSRPLPLEDSNNSTDTEDTKPIAHFTQLVDPMEITTTQPQVQFVPIQPKPFKNVVEINGGLHLASNGTYESEEPLRKVSRCLDELVSMQRDDRTDDVMGNKKFLLSLLPFMKRLPDDVNLEVRLQLMSILETYTKGRQQT